jgi:hypothetical protein
MKQHEVYYTAHREVTRGGGVRVRANGVRLPSPSA